MLRSLFAILLATHPQISNPNIDMAGYLRVAQEAAAYREGRRVTEEEFLQIAAEPRAIILDARSGAKYRALHVKGAINLSFPDITAASLREAIPDPSAPVLIYCNNNFLHAEREFPSKASRASLNLSTFIALYSYGYRNIYELGPLVDIHQSKLPFEPDVNDRASSPSAPESRSAPGSR